MAEFSEHELNILRRGLLHRVAGIRCEAPTKENLERIVESHQLIRTINQLVVKRRREWAEGEVARYDGPQVWVEHAVNVLCAGKSREDVARLITEWDATARERC